MACSAVRADSLRIILSAPLMILWILFMSDGRNGEPVVWRVWIMGGGGGVIVRALSSEIFQTYTRVRE